MTNFRRPAIGETEYPQGGTKRSATKSDILSTSRNVLSQEFQEMKEKYLPGQIRVYPEPRSKGATTICNNGLKQTVFEPPWPYSAAKYSYHPADQG